METTRFRGQTVEDAVAAACAVHGAEADIVATQMVAARGLRGLAGLREVEVVVTPRSTAPRQPSVRRPAPVQSDDAPSIGAFVNQRIKEHFAFREIGPRRFRPGDT